MSRQPNGGFIGKENITDNTTASGVYTLSDVAQKVANNEFPPARFTPSRSLRFASARSTYLSRTPATAGSRTTWTMSMWIKIGSLTSSPILFSAGTSGNFNVSISSISDPYLRVRGSTLEYITNVKFRDFSSWYHLVFTADTTNSNAYDRFIVYVNGRRLSYSAGDYLTSNYTNAGSSEALEWNNNSAHNIGRYAFNGTSPFDGYMAEVNFIDGQKLTPAAFAESDPRTGEWRPKRYTGSYGTNGFYLSFANNSSTSTLGLDDGTGLPGSGAGSNDWASSGHSLTAGVNYDSMVDVPGVGSPVTNDTGGVSRGNYCTINPLDTNGSSLTVSNGNLRYYTPSSGVARGTLGVTTGKWYFEILQESNVTPSTPFQYGIASLNGNAAHGASVQGATMYTDNGSGRAFWRTTSSGIVQTVTPSSFSVSVNDILQVAYDADTGKLWFGKNNTWYDGSGGTSGNPSLGVNPVYNLPDTTQPMSPLFDHAGAAYTATLNCGQRPFSYTPPAGFKSLCTTNLPEPTVKNPKEHFDIKLWTGNERSITIGNTTRERDNYEISRSLRFNRADSAFLSRTAVTPTDGKKATFSFWIKKCEISEDTSFSYRSIFYAGTPNVDGLRIAYARYSGDGHSFVITQDNGSSAAYFTARTNTRFKDVSSWFHIVIQYDSTLSSSNQRFNIYVNGVKQSFQSSPTYPPLNHIPRWQINGTTLKIGKGRDDVNEHIDMYLTEVNFIDGQALTAESFGSFDVDGSWQAKTYTGTYGNNGYYLNFSDNSNTTSTTLGKDQAGSNNWTPSGFSVAAGVNNDSFVDVPTDWGGDSADGGGEVRGNYCTFGLKRGSTYYPTISNGNLTCQAENNTQNPAFGTFSVSSGKWYYEVYVENQAYSPNIGWTEDGKMGTGDNWRSLNNSIVYNTYSGTGYVTVTTSNGTSSSGYSQNSSGSWAWTTGNTVMVALDADAKKVWYGINGTWHTFNGGVGSPSTDEYPTAIYPWNLPMVPAFDGSNNGGNKDKLTYNFGQRPFAYTAPAGFKSLNTKNINDQFPFVTGPDLVWIKRRNATSQHVWSDTVRGINREIYSSSAQVQQSNQPGVYVNEFDSNSFTLGSGSAGTGDANILNGTYVSWIWNAGSRTIGNQDGAISSTVRVNKDAGFSIVSYSGTGADTTVGHGLGKTPDFIIWKALDDNYNWDIYHSKLGYQSTLIFTDANTRNVLHASPTSTTLPVKHLYSGGSAVGKRMIAYCWYEVPGYSKFGSYTGNSSTNGPFIYTGFKPRYVLIKKYSGGNLRGWCIYDTARSPANGGDFNHRLEANSSIADDSGSGGGYIDVLSNGFILRTTAIFHNESGSNYVYAAFAETPFKYSNAR